MRMIGNAHSRLCGSASSFPQGLLPVQDDCQRRRLTDCPFQHEETLAITCDVIRRSARHNGHRKQAAWCVALDSGSGSSDGCSQHAASVESEKEKLFAIAAPLRLA